MTKRLEKQKGFTLVELAIVLVIVGLLIAGILKGQELITNSQITSTIQQMESFGGAVNTFKQNYGAYPGDMSNASTRLADCAANPCNNGTGDSVIGVNVGGVPTLADEGAFFFNHLRAAELITSFDGTATLQFGAALPNASIGGGYLVGDNRTGATGFTAAELRRAPHLVLTSSVANVATGTGVLSPTQAARIDRTIDDGAPDSGSVVAQSGNAADCRSAVDTYDEGATSSCVIAYRLPL